MRFRVTTAYTVSGTKYQKLKKIVIFPVLVMFREMTHFHLRLMDI